MKARGMRHKMRDAEGVGVGKEIFPRKSRKIQNWVFELYILPFWGYTRREERQMSKKKKKKKTEKTAWKKEKLFNLGAYDSTFNTVRLFASLCTELLAFLPFYFIFFHFSLRLVYSVPCILLIGGRPGRKYTKMRKEIFYLSNLFDANIIRKFYDAFNEGKWRFCAAIRS